MSAQGREHVGLVVGFRIPMRGYETATSNGVRTMPLGSESP